MLNVRASQQAEETDRTSDGIRSTEGNDFNSSRPGSARTQGLERAPAQFLLFCDLIGPRHLPTLQKGNTLTLHSVTLTNQK